MGHKDHHHGRIGLPHAGNLTHDHGSGHLDEPDHGPHVELGDGNPPHWESLWIDLGGEG